MLQPAIMMNKLIFQFGWRISDSKHILAETNVGPGDNNDDSDNTYDDEY